MVSYFVKLAWVLQPFRVLILVVMEDGLVLRYMKRDKSFSEVLILVVMEDGLVLVIEVEAPDGTKRS